MRPPLRCRLCPHDCVTPRPPTHPPPTSVCACACVCRGTTDVACWCVGAAHVCFDEGCGYRPCLPACSIYTHACTRAAAPTYPGAACFACDGWVQREVAAPTETNTHRCARSRHWLGGCGHSCMSIPPRWHSQLPRQQPVQRLQPENANAHTHTHTRPRRVCIVPTVRGGRLCGRR